MNKKILLLALSLLLIGCNNSQVNSSSTNTSDSIISSSEISSSNSSFSSDDISSSINNSNQSSSNNSSSSQEVIDVITSISECKTRYVELLNQVNEYQVAESDIQVELSGKVLARFDAITSKSGYGNRYKILIANDEGYIYLKVSQEVYSYLENKIGQSILVKGTLSSYCGECEVTVNQDVTLLSETFEVTDLFVSQSFDQVQEQILSLDTNIKGCAISSLVKISGQYIGEMDDKVLLFYDGNKVLFVHGPDKFKNGLTLNKVYDIYGAISLYNYRPGIEFVEAKINSELVINPIDKTKLYLINSDIYNINYQVDTDFSYLDYTNMFFELKLFRGYANLYYKNSSGYVVLDSLYHNEEYSSYTSARNNKALFVKNENYTNLYTSQDYLNCPLYDYLCEEIYLDMVVVRYLWNTNKYWQVYILDNCINTL